MTLPPTLTSAPSAPAPRRHDGPPPRHVSRLPAGWIVDALLILLVLVAAMIVRVVFVSNRVPAFVTPDSDDYLWPGYALARGLGFEPELRRTPLYPVFIAVVIGLGGTLSTIVVVQHALGVVTAGLTYLLGRVSFGRLAGLIAGLAVAISGPLLIYEHFLMSEAFFTCVLTLALLALVGALRRPTAGWLVLSGALVAATALTRPIGQAVVPLALGLPVLLALLRPPTPRPPYHGAPVSPRPPPAQAGEGEPRHKESDYGRWREAIRQGSLVACGLAIVMAPWTIRNLVVHGTTGAEGALGQALIGRTVRHDKGFLYDDPAHPDPDPIRAAAGRIIQQESDSGEPSGGTITARVRDELGLTQAQTSTLLRDLAVREITEQPGHYVTTTRQMAWELFQGRNERLLGNWRERITRNWDRKWDPRLVVLLDEESPAEGDLYQRADAVTSFFQPWRWRTMIGWLFGIGLLFSIVMPRFRPALAPGLTVLVLVLAAAALDGLVWRFRYPADPAIAVVAAGGLAAPIGFLRTLVRARIAGGRSNESMMSVESTRQNGSARAVDNTRGPGLAPVGSPSPISEEGKI